MKAKTLKAKRLVRNWLKQNKVKQLPDAMGIPLSSLTVCPKSHRYNGIFI